MANTLANSRILVEDAVFVQANVTLYVRLGDTIMPAC